MPKRKADSEAEPSLQNGRSLRSGAAHRNVAIVGGGVIGRRIACAWVAGGFNVCLFDRAEKQRRDALRYVQENIEVYAGYLKQEKPETGTISPSTNIKSAVQSAWLVIEAVPEDLGLKTDVFGELASILPPDAFLCSNSSSFRTAAMLKKVPQHRRSRVLNMHYMMLPSLRVVELMTCGHTDPAALAHLRDQNAKLGLCPVILKNQSTGFVHTRLWAALKREILTTLSEGVADPEDIDTIWTEVNGSKCPAPCYLMDMVGLDTVASIEKQYMQERGLSGDSTVSFLQRNYLDVGKLGSKSRRGGLYPPKSVARGFKADEATNKPTLYFLDLGFVANPEEALTAGRVLAGTPDGTSLRVIASGQNLPESLDISCKTGRLYWSNMGFPPANDGSLMSCNRDGGDLRTLLPPGTVHTPKQITIDQNIHKIYLCDREGLRIVRCNLDGSQLEDVVRTGDMSNASEKSDSTRWPVGLVIDFSERQIYWTQKGPAKGGRGRIFRAALDVPEGQSPANRQDVECLIERLPEPVDLDLDPHEKVLYWTDRGEVPHGNSLNRCPLSEFGKRNTGDGNPKYEIIARNLHEAIGLKLDLRNRALYAADLGGRLYRFALDGTERKKLFEEQGTFTGVNLLYEQMAPIVDSKGHELARG